MYISLKSNKNNFKLNKKNFKSNIILQNNLYDFDFNLNNNTNNFDLNNDTSKNIFALHEIDNTQKPNCICFIVVLFFYLVSTVTTNIKKEFLSNNETCK
tara:strand:- start:509 stop:805 length:297 start_codon:yes stop_codon:yes gene_type:complete